MEQWNHGTSTLQRRIHLRHRSLWVQDEIVQGVHPEREVLMLDQTITTSWLALTQYIQDLSCLAVSKKKQRQLFLVQTRHPSTSRVMILRATGFSFRGYKPTLLETANLNLQVRIRHFPHRHLHMRVCLTCHFQPFLFPFQFQSARHPTFVNCPSPLP